MPNGWRTIKSVVHKIKFDFTADEGKEWVNPSREKSLGTHRRNKVDEKSCVTFLLCDPGWYVQRTWMSRMDGKKTHTHKYIDKILGKTDNRQTNRPFVVYRVNRYRLEKKIWTHLNHHLNLIYFEYIYPVRGEIIGSRNCAYVPTAFTAESPPARHP